ncbi:thymidine phosphorylase [bacterium]|nr:thymidine phosphorylase [bacterium]
MNPVELIINKRDGKHFTASEIQWLVDSYTREEIPDYQMSALLMAIYFQGMNRDEMTALTKAMIESGKSLDLSSIEAIKVDKHSTGGVGDKVSLILAPLVAAAGVTVPMMAGRGLGHTGGTLDKLEAIPGFRTELSESEFFRQLSKIGCAIVGQTEQMVPADRQLYALRDVTGTVPSIPLICSSILSKKKAEGADALVLDVKIGNGAFFNDREITYRLARTLVELGNILDLKTQALITNMDQPLGNTIGNWIETREAMKALQGNGAKDLMDVTLALGSLMLVQAGKIDDYHTGFEILQDVLDSGRAWQRFIEMVAMQGGDVSVLNHPDIYPKPVYQAEVKASCSGNIYDMNACSLGLAALSLGAGRVKKTDAVDPKAGILLYKKVGDSVSKGEPLALLTTDCSQELGDAMNRVAQAIDIRDASPQIQPLIETLILADEELIFSLPD